MHLSHALMDVKYALSDQLGWAYGWLQLNPDLAQLEAEHEKTRIQNLAQIKWFVTMTSWIQAYNEAVALTGTGKKS